MGKVSPHTFYDVSKSFYATCVFLRNDLSNLAACKLIQACSREAPFKEISIPCLELLACCIGAIWTDSV